MRIALNGATTMRADLVTDIQAARQAGFDLIEIWAAKLWDFLAHRSVSDLKHLFSEHGVSPYSINSLENITFRSADDERDLIEKFEHLCRIARELECPYIVAVPSPCPPDVSHEEVTEESVRVLTLLAEYAVPYGVQLAFEFLGFTSCSVRTLDHSWEIIQRVNQPSVGLVIDTFHFYVGGSTLESLRIIPPDRIFIVHINDAEDRPRSELHDHHRLLPSRGSIPLREIISALRSCGYDRVVSVEIFRPEYWAWDPIVLAEQSRRAVEEVLSQAGYSLGK